jgi:hypothetical protein
LVHQTPSKAVKQSMFSTKNPGLFIPGNDTTYPNLVSLVNAHSNRIKTPIGYYWSGVEEDLAHQESAVKNSIFIPPEKSEPEEPVTNNCIVCTERPQNCLFLECGHMCCCSECAARLKKCPACRQTIARIVPVFQL